MMKDTIIYELTTDEFNDAVVINTAFDRIKGRRLQFGFDDPAFFENMFTNVRQGDIILC